MSIIGRAELHQYEDEIGGIYLGSENESPPRLSHGMMPTNDKEKRIRREIANSNERRRMQSINAGFQSLRTLLPHHEGEKLSKASILQQTAEYIYSLEQEKTRLLAQNCQLKRLIEHDRNDGECTVNKKRKTESGILGDSTDEGVAGDGLITDPVEGMTTSEEELVDMRVQLDRERNIRLVLEDRLRTLQSKLYPRDVSLPLHVQYDDEEMSSRRHDMDSLIDESDTASGSGLEIAATPHISVAHTETVIATSASPTEQEPVSNTTTSTSASLLEGVVIKTEPRADVEPIQMSPEHSSSLEEPTSVTSLPRSKVFLASSSRPNLETIVEAIRHLEGDNLFEDGSETQDAPLALTKHQHDSTPTSTISASHHTSSSSNLRVDINPYLQFHQQQQRPGVIVVKHS